MSDAPDKKFDPTESIRTLTSAPFKESYMTLREHQDTDRHYIGDSLPVPSASMIQTGGVASSPGVLPFVARADHVHESRIVWGYFNSSNVVVAPGNVYINTLSYTGWGKNMLASGQVLAFPYHGVYLIQLSLAIGRVSGGLFTNEMNVVFTYNNGSQSKTVLRQSNFDLPSPMYLNISDVVVNNTAPSANDNLQIAIQHNDSDNWNVSAQQLFVFKLSSEFSS